MAKKLNQKVALICIILIALIVGGGAGALVLRKMKRNPDKALAKARVLKDAGDYENADKEFYNSIQYEKDSDKKIENLFEYAEFHLIQNEQHEADWTKAMSCWNTVINMETDNIDARMKQLDYYYQMANAGGAAIWKRVHENTTELLDTLKAQGKELDPFVLKAHGQAMLSMSQRGDTPNRRELLAESVDIINQLIGQEPGNEEYYQMMASASQVEGELGKLSGVMNARENAEKEALQWLEKGIEASDDKSTATANLLVFKLQTGGNDPNLIEDIRTEIAARSEQVEPNGKLLLVTSIAYEQPGGMSPEAALNRAIDTIQQARELEPDNAEYTIRMARLLYRKGSAFRDADAISDAIDIAEKGLLLPTTQDIPGPLSGLQKYHRNLLNSFLANVFLEKAYAAQRAEDSASQTEWAQKAERRIAEIRSYYASADDNPNVQKYDGMLLVAKGDKDKGIALMYKAYEQSKALDQQQQLSRIDPLLCVTLAELMKEAGELGMQREFLEKTFYNQNRIVLQKPDLILDYAELMGRFRSWGAVAGLVENYQNQYGATVRSLELQTKAAIGIWQAAVLSVTDEMPQEQLVRVDEIAQEQLAKAAVSLSALEAMDGAMATQLKLDLLNSRITQLVRTIERSKSKNEDPDADIIAELAALRQQRNEQLSQALKTYAESLESQVISVTYYDLLRDEKVSEAVTILDAYLAAHPDNLNLKVLRLQAKEADPLQIKPERRLELQEKVFQEISDPDKRALTLTQFYRAQGKYEQAQEALETLGQSAIETNVDVLREHFELALASEDVEKADSLLRSMRMQNADGFEGFLSGAQIEVLKENYSGAISQLDRCLVMKPLSSLPYFLKSQVHVKEGKMEEAVENARKATSMSLMNSLYARNLTVTLFARNTALGSKATPEQHAEAEQAVRIARSLNPNDASLQSLYAKIISVRQPDRALSIRKQLLENNPTVTNALLLGNMAMEMSRSEWDPVKKTGLIEDAGKAYQKAFEIDPENEDAIQSLADYKRLTGEENIEDMFPNENMVWKYYLRGGQFDQAREILEKLYSETPSDPLIVRGLIMTESGAGNRDKVKPYLDALAKLDPDKDTELWILQKYLDTGYAEEAASLLASFKERYPEEKTALLIDAWTQMGKGKLDEALSLTNRYLETNTQNPGAWRLRGRLYRLMNDPQNAIKDLQQSKSIQEDPMVRLELATVYNETNQVQAAIGELKQGLDDPQAPIQLRLLLESIYQKNNSLRDLEEFYQSTLEKFPASTFWMYRVGLFYLNQKNYKQAQAILEPMWNAGLEQDRPDGNVLNAYLESLSQDNQNEKALATVSELIDTPLAPLAYAWMGQIQSKQGQNDTAIESFDMALEKAGINDSLQGVILSKMQDSVGNEAVVSWYERQLAADQDSLAAHLMAYRLALQEGEYNKAIEHVDRCIEVIGEDSPAWIAYALKKANVLIMAYTKTTDTDYLSRSITLFENILAIQPNNPSLLNNMAYLLADNDQQLDRALEYSLKAHQRDPGNPIFLDTHAYIQCKTGDYEKAEQNLLRAIQIYDVSKTPIPWDLYKHLGMAQEGLGKAKPAAESYQKALDSTDVDGKPQVIPEKERQQLQETIDRLKQS